MQQIRGMQPNPQRCAKGQSCKGMPRFDIDGNPPCPQSRSTGARQALMIEAAKQQDGFNPRHVTDIVRMTQQLPVVQRASSNPSSFRLIPTSRKSEAMQEILGRCFDWQADSIQQQPQQSLEPSLVPSHGRLEVTTTHGPQVSALEFGQHFARVNKGLFSDAYAASG